MKIIISIRDTFVPKARKENFYHGVLLGILGRSSLIETKSNIEAGNGFSDITIFDEMNGRGVVIEVKYAQNGYLISACKEGLKQIEDMDYGDVFRLKEIEKIHKYAIACHLKECEVLCG